MKIFLFCFICFAFFSRFVSSSLLASSTITQCVATGEIEAVSIVTRKSSFLFLSTADKFVLLSAFVALLAFHFDSLLMVASFLLPLQNRTESLYVTLTSATDDSGDVEVLKNPMWIVIEKSPVYIRYPIVYFQDFNNKPIEHVCHNGEGTISHFLHLFCFVQ